MNQPKLSTRCCIAHYATSSPLRPPPLRPIPPAWALFNPSLLYIGKRRDNYQRPQSLARVSVKLMFSCVITPDPNRITTLRHPTTKRLCLSPWPPQITPTRYLYLRSMCNVKLRCLLLTDSTVVRRRERRQWKLFKRFCNSSVIHCTGHCLLEHALYIRCSLLFMENYPGSLRECERSSSRRETTPL